MQRVYFAALLLTVTPTATPTTMAMMTTGDGQQGPKCAGRGCKLTNDDQRVPLPSPGIAGAGNRGVQLGVGLLHVGVRLFGALVDLSDGRFLLVDELGHFLVQLAQLDHVLFDLADGGGSLDRGLAGIVGLASASTGDLDWISDHRKRNHDSQHTKKACSWPAMTF